MAEIAIETTKTPTTVSGRLKAARVALILIPIFVVAVTVIAFAGIGKQQSVAQENARPAETEQTADPALVEAVTAAIPEDTPPEQRARIIEAVEKSNQSASQSGNGGPNGQGRGQRGEGGPGALGGLFNLFFLMAALAIGMGIWILLSSKQRRIPRIIFNIALPLMVLSGLATMGLGFVALNEKPEEKRRPFNTLAVMADYAIEDDVRLSVTTQGETTPQVEIDLVPEVGGKIVYVSPNFIEGGIFKRGETLVRIDPADYQTALVSAEASLANAQQQLAREVAEGEIARGDIAELGIENPSALALRTPQRQQAEAAVRAAEAEVARARTQLGRTNVRAPFAGRVSDKTADVGQFVGPGTRLGRIFSTDVIEVRLPLTDADLAKLDLPIAFVAENRETAPKVVLSTEIAGKRREWNARIVRTDAAYDTQTRALFAIAEVRDPYGAGMGDAGYPLAPGLFVDAEIEGRALEGMIVLPRDGLRPRDEVYVVDDEGKAEIRTVEVVDTDVERAVLRPGLIRAGELVVLSPMERSRIETPLKVLDANDPKTVLVEPKRPAWMGDDDDEAPARDNGSRERETTSDGETASEAGESGDGGNATAAGSDGE